MTILNHVGTIGGSLGDHVEIILGSFGNHLGIIRGSFRNHFGIIRESFWDHFVIIVSHCKIIFKLMFDFYAPAGPSLHFHRVPNILLISWSHMRGIWDAYVGQGADTGPHCSVRASSRLVRIMDAHSACYHDLT